MRRTHLAMAVAVCTAVGQRAMVEPNIAYLDLNISSKYDFTNHRNTKNFQPYAVREQTFANNVKAQISRNRPIIHNYRQS